MPPAAPKNNPPQAEIAVQLHTQEWKAKLRPYCKTVREACWAALEPSGCHLELTVVLADDAMVKELNRDFRGKNKPTNVLSFPGDGHLGDIVLAFETVAREAEEQGKSIRAHTQHLLVHGVLHLLGYDHMKDDEAEHMEKKEIKILKKLGVTNPYL